MTTTGGETTTTNPDEVQMRQLYDENYERYEKYSLIAEILTAIDSNHKIAFAELESIWATLNASESEIITPIHRQHQQPESIVEKNNQLMLERQLEQVDKQGRFIIEEL